MQAIALIFSLIPIFVGMAAGVWIVDGILSRRGKAWTKSHVSYLLGGFVFAIGNAACLIYVGPVADFIQSS